MFIYPTHRHDGAALHDLLYHHLPAYRSPRLGKRLDIQKLALDLGITCQAVYSWFEKKESKKAQSEYFLPPVWVKPLCNLNGSTLTPEILFPYTILG